jgi:hypothetical protein
MAGDNNPSRKNESDAASLSARIAKANHSMEKLSPEDMTSASFRHYQALAKSDKITVFVDNRDESEKPNITALPGKGGSATVVINDSAHQYTEQYVRQTRMSSDADIKKFVADGTYIPITEANGAQFGLSAETIEKYKETAKKMGVQPAPPLYQQPMAFPDVPPGQSQMTVEGTPYVLINALSIGQYSPAEQMGILGHELAHLKHGDTTPAAIAAAHNDATGAIAKAEELNADKTGTGPSGTCDPASLASVLQEHLNESKKEFENEHPGVPFKGRPSHDYPTLNYRIRLLQAEARDDGACSPSNAATAPPAATNKEPQQKAVPSPKTGP